MAKRTKRKKKMNFGTFAGFAVLVFVVVFGTVLMRDYTGTAPKAPTTSSYVDVRTVVVEQGATTSDIAQELKQQGVIRFPLFFRVVSRLAGCDAQYKKGTFAIRPNAGYRVVFDVLTNAANAQNETVKITIPEGFELRQIADRLAESGLVDRDAFYREVEYGQFDYEFIRKLPNRENRLEGYLFPDTYLFTKDDTAQDIINKMLARFEEIVYSPQNITRAKELGMSMDEVVTLASIIEREALGDADRKDVSSVFHNRLKSREYPYLQSCATVQYILKERKTILSEADTKIQSPYNTYRNKGLPVGPIASPGAEAVDAALYPNNTNYLFFVLGSDGVHHFSKTYDEHLAHAG